MLGCAVSPLHTGRVVLFIIAYLPGIYCTFRYYGAVLPFGSGDNIITTWRMQGGSTSPLRRWNVECLDGEAVAGIQDQSDDFQKILAIWCRFMFPYKPPTHGKYPYYPSCIYRDYRFQFFCFDAQNASMTINTFVTAFYDNEFQFWTARMGTTRAISNDWFQPYKCCKTPKGYYIDYVSCYYMPTHDIYWEYYDNPTHFIVTCGTNYVVTGIAKKVLPFGNEWAIDWIQCCRKLVTYSGKCDCPLMVLARIESVNELSIVAMYSCCERQVGYGAATVVSPPLITHTDGRRTFYAHSSSSPVPKPAAYMLNQRSLSVGDTTNSSHPVLKTVDELGSMRYKRRSGIPLELRDRASTDSAAVFGDDGRNIVMRDGFSCLT